MVSKTQYYNRIAIGKFLQVSFLHVSDNRWITINNIGVKENFV